MSNAWLGSYVGWSMPRELFLSEHMSQGAGVVIVSLDPSSQTEIRLVQRRGLIDSISLRHGGTPLSELHLHICDWHWRSRDHSGTWQRSELPPRLQTGDLAPTMPAPVMLLKPAFGQHDLRTRDLKTTELLPFSNKTTCSTSFTFMVLIFAILRSMAKPGTQHLLEPISRSRCFNPRSCWWTNWFIGRGSRNALSVCIGVAMARLLRGWRWSAS